MNNEGLLLPLNPYSAEILPGYTQIWNSPKDFINLSYPQFPEVCFKCLATRGNRCFSLVYTDVTDSAGWRQTVGILDPWLFPSAFCNLHGFDQKMIQVDFMHTWQLGIAQDLIGSTIKVLCRKRGMFPGHTIALRLNQLFAEVKAWAREHGQQIGLKRLRKHTLSWSKGCPVFKSKAADSNVFLQYLNAKLQREPPPHGSPYPGLVAAVWAADQLSGCLMRADTFLTAEEKHHTTVVGSMFLTTYAGLACEAIEAAEYLFKMRPKFHHLQHMLEDDRPSLRSPAWDNCFIFEDHIKHCVKMLRKTSHRTAERHLLRRNAAAVRHHTLKLLLNGK